MRPALLSVVLATALFACSSSERPTSSAPPPPSSVDPPSNPTETPSNDRSSSRSAPGAQPTTGNGPHHLRYLAINIGNVSIDCHAYEYKLCSAVVSDRIREYIATWQPDVVLVSEVLDEPQLDRVLHDSDLRAGGSPTSNLGGPILPPGYAHVCHPNVNRFDGASHDEHPLDDTSASHRHECVAWRRDRLAFVSAAHALGPNSAELRPKCNYDFTMQAATLRLIGASDASGLPIDVTGIAVHPASDSEDVACRKDTIRRMWSDLAKGPRVFLGGDFNTGVDAELQVPPSFLVNYSHGRHFDVAHTGEYTAAYYIRGSFEFDHAFSNFGRACTSCGIHYGGSPQNLPFGSAVGDWHAHPWAAKPGIDHRQILVDLELD